MGVLGGLWTLLLLPLSAVGAFLFLLALAGYFGAHRQRWVTGLELYRDSNDKPREPFNTAVDKLWQSENPDVKFGEFQQTDLSGYINAIEQKVLHIAVTTRTPRHYLIQQGQSPSGDAIQAAESGLVKKVERKQRELGEGFEEALRLARRFQGATDSPPDSEVVWRSAETHTPGVIVDSVIKLYIGGLIPRSFALEKAGLTQTEIRKILEMHSTHPDEFAANTDASPLVNSAQHSDLLRNLPKGA